MMGHQETLSVREVSFGYRNHPVLQKVSFSLAPMDFLCLLGPNGVGKSTLFRCILGINTGYSGNIFLGNKNLRTLSTRELAEKIAYIPQYSTPVFGYTVFEMVLMGTAGSHSLFSSPGKAQKEAAHRAIERMGISHLSDRSIAEISGGERQLALIARALAQDADYLLMDEPTSALDPISTSKVEELATELKENYTIVMVTPTTCSRPRVSAIRRHFSCWASWWRWARRSVCSPRPWTSAPRITSRAASAKEVRQMGTSVRKMYDAELLQLDTMLARMGHAAGGAIESAMTALRTGDTELARSVIARDSEIDSAEHEIEHRCLTLFLRQQPVAGDLRKVSTALKMVTDIERIADQASDIAEITLHLHPDGARTVGVLDDLYAMGDIALHMVKDAIAAYVQVDLSTAAQVIARDDDCDAMFSRISKEIAAYIAAHPSDAETALDLFMIDKYLERLGDHAVNIAEWVEFLKTGVHKSRKIV